MSAVAGRVQGAPSGDSEIQEYRERLRVFIVGPRLGIGAAFSFSVHYHYAGNQDLAAGGADEEDVLDYPKSAIGLRARCPKASFPQSETGQASLMTDWITSLGRGQVRWKSGARCLRGQYHGR